MTAPLRPRAAPLCRALGGCHIMTGGNAPGDPTNLHGRFSEYPSLVRSKKRETCSERSRRTEERQFHDQTKEIL
jgi:hypothetical protein